MKKLEQNFKASMYAHGKKRTGMTYLLALNGININPKTTKVRVSFSVWRGL